MRRICMSALLLSAMSIPAISIQASADPLQVTVYPYGSQPVYVAQQPAPAQVYYYVQQPRYAAAPGYSGGQNYGPSYGAPGYAAPDQQGYARPAPQPYGAPQSYAGPPAPQVYAAPAPQAYASPVPQRYAAPAPQTYAHVEKELGTAPSDMFMIACHTWDTLGAKAAGWGAALIKRPGNDVLSVGPQPDMVGDSLSGIALQLMRR